MGINPVDLPFSVEGQPSVPATLRPEVPKANPKRTFSSCAVYLGLEVKQNSDWKQPYLVPKVKKVYSESFTAPIGAIVCYSYSTGSWGKIYYQWWGYFLVCQRGEEVIPAPDKEGREKQGKVTVKNLVLLEEPSKEVRGELEAYVLNKYGAKPSQYHPVLTLLYLFTKHSAPLLGRPQPRKVEFTITSVEDVDRAIEELKKLRAQLEEPRIRGVIASTPPS